MTPSEPSHQPNNSRGTLRWIAIALTLRIILMLVRPDDLQNDADAYLGHARTLAEGNGYCVPDTVRPTAFRPPGLPFALAGMQWIGCSEVIAVAIVNLLATAALIVAVSWLCRDQNFSARTQSLAFAGLTLDPLLLRYSVMPMTEVPSAAALVMGTSLLFKRSLQKHHCAVAGLILGLGALIRPTLLLSIAIGFALMTVDCIRKSKSPKLVFAFGLCAATAVLPWTIRNAVHWQRFLPATTHGGYTMLLGNNETFYQEVVNATQPAIWKGESLKQWQREIKNEATKDGVDLSNESQVDRWNQKLAIASIQRNPSTFVKAIALRWSRFWGPVPEVESVPAVAKWGIGLWYVVVFVLAATGLLWLKRKHGLLVAIISFNVIAFMGLHAVYWANARMRTPLMPLLIVAAAFAADQLIASMQKKLRPSP